MSFFRYVLNSVPGACPADGFVNLMILHTGYCGVLQVRIITNHSLTDKRNKRHLMYVTMVKQEQYENDSRSVWHKIRTYKRKFHIKLLFLTGRDKKSNN